MAAFEIEKEALKYTRLRGLTRQLKGQPPGPEGSILKLASSDAGGTSEIQHNIIGERVLGLPKG